MAEHSVRTKKENHSFSLSPHLDTKSRDFDFFSRHDSWKRLSFITSDKEHSRVEHMPVVSVYVQGKDILGCGCLKKNNSCFLLRNVDFLSLHLSGSVPSLSVIWLKLFRGEVNLIFKRAGRMVFRAQTLNEKGAKDFQSFKEQCVSLISLVVFR